MNTTATITSLGQRGEGLAEIGGKRVYVPFTLPGEAVDVAVEGERGRLLAVITPSPHRITPFCPHFGICGGCQLQHFDAETYAAVQARPGRDGAEPCQYRHRCSRPLIDARGDGRRRATLHARKDGAGFMAFHTHDLHDIDDCPILVPALPRRRPSPAPSTRAVGDCDVALTATPDRPRRRHQARAKKPRPSG